ncbi:MAG TPA: hypothetical protein VL993_03235 [Stellaceae bacterium]|nr:hypothetical protein [Stellaceae bacterium]
MPRVLVFAVFLLAGCSTWTKPGATPDQLAADESLCNQRALYQAPLDMSSLADAGPGANAPGYSCTNRGCVPSSSPFSGSGLTDRNGAIRSVLFSQCMKERGWTP